MAEYNGAVRRRLRDRPRSPGRREGGSRRCGVEPARGRPRVFGNALQTSGDAIYGARHVGLKAGRAQRGPGAHRQPPLRLGLPGDRQRRRSRILLGEANAVLAGGTENMTQAPHVIRGAREGLQLGKGAARGLAVVGAHRLLLRPPWRRPPRTSRRSTASPARSRTTLRAALAAARGRGQEPGGFAEEIVPVEVKAGRKTRRASTSDEHPRPDTTLEGLAKLPPGRSRRTAWSPPATRRGSATAPRRVVVASAQRAAAARA